jgi:hypothetical protein
MTLGLLGYAGAVIRIQPLIGWTELLRLEMGDPGSPHFEVWEPTPRR